MTSEMFSNLSTFYIDLWQHVDAFLDENRWLRVHPVLNINERVRVLEARYEALSSKIRDPTLAAQVSRDLEDVQVLTQNYIKQKPEPGSQWFRQAEKVRSYLQELGLRYAELASTRARGG